MSPLHQCGTSPRLPASGATVPVANGYSVCGAQAGRLRHCYGRLGGSERLHPLYTLAAGLGCGRQPALRRPHLHNPSTLSS